MRSIYLITTLIYLITIVGCSQDVERENPLDVQNQRTSGVITNVKAKAGDSQVLISWPNLGFEGIKEFKIYRAYRTPESFIYITSIQPGEPKEIPEYSFLDKGSPGEPLKNDGDNMYYYRITYVDKDGVETPDPANPINLQKGWFNVNLIPSEAPPIPNVKVMEDTDLQVRLVWEGYSKIAPADLAGFKIYSAPKAEKGQEQAPLRLIYTIEDPRVEFYVDGNDYAANKISFRKDGETKLYKVVAFDKVGVESNTPILQGTSPNLPPSPPAQVKATFALGLNTYNVRLEWRRNLEPDVIGYKVYALWPDGKREFKEWKTDPNDTVTEITMERYVIVEGVGVPKSYYITAYDNTKKDNDINDESEPSQIMSAQ